jgi:hypothetical protein
MTLPREPRIHPVSIAALRPTQITVGMREVKAKRKSWRDHPDRKKADFLGKHLIPVIWGPKDGHDPVQRIPVGGLSPSPNQAQSSQ